MEQKAILEGILQDKSVTYTLTLLCRICVVEPEVIEQMVEHGILEPIGNTPASWEFDYLTLPRAKKALRLQRDLAINWAGVSLALDLLNEIEELRHQLRCSQPGNNA